MISKLRDDADLSNLRKEPITGKKGSPKKYGEKIDVKNLNPEHFKQVENNQGIKAFFGIVYSKSLGRNILLVAEELQIKGKTIYRLLYSTKTEHAPIDVINIYHTMFQIVFGFRDAKQFASLKLKVKKWKLTKFSFQLGIDNGKYCQDNATDQS